MYFDSLLTMSEVIEMMDEATGMKTSYEEKYMLDFVSLAYARWKEEVPVFVFLHLFYTSFDQSARVREIIEEMQLVEKEPNHYYRAVAEKCLKMNKHDLSLKASILSNQITDLANIITSKELGETLYSLEGEKITIMSASSIRDEILTKSKILDIIDSLI
jgi:hypothetical protein